MKYVGCRIPINHYKFLYRNLYIILIPLYIMDSFATWVLRGLSEMQGKYRLSQISDLIDLSPIRRILDEMYDNKSEKGWKA